jgi:subtilisin family serine protease
MNSCPPGLKRSITTLVVVPLLAFGAASCGRSLTAPVAAGRAAARAQTNDGAYGLELVVTLADGVDAQALASAYGAEVVESAPGARVATLRPGPSQGAQDLQQQLASDSSVVTVEPNGWLETAESRQQSFAFDDGLETPEAFAEQPAAGALHLGAAHAVASGRGVTVAILDTGIDPNHPLLSGVYEGGVDLVDHDDDPTETRDGVDDDGDGQVDEAFGHGTHVAGIIHLVAPEARLLAVRVLNDDGLGSMLKIVVGVRWAMQHGAKVINLSLGALQQSQAVERALEDAEAQGIVVVVSAGNWGSDTPVEFPASSSSVAAVAAVDAAGNAASFSSYGANVALAAPGVAIRSTYPGADFRLWSGTSMSSPFVAGTCALLAELHPGWTRSEMLARIGGTAGYISADGRAFGAGSLDAGAALAPDGPAIESDPQSGEDVRPH